MRDRTHLKQLDKLIDDVRRTALLLGFLQTRVRLDDFRQLVRQVVLCARLARGNDGRSDGRRWDGQDGEHHPVRARKLVRETEHFHIGRRHFFQDVVAFLRREVTLVGDTGRVIFPALGVGGVLFLLLVHGEHLGAFASNERLTMATASMARRRQVALLVRPFILLTDHDPLGGLVHILEPVLGLESIQRREQVAVAVIDFELAAVGAHGLEDLFHGLHESGMKDGPREFNMAKVPGTLGHAFTARLALGVPVDG